MRVPLVTIFYFLLFSPPVIAQTITTQQMQQKLDVLANNFPQEKIYLHYDKPVYSPGETIWFKAYLMSGISPSNISKTLYVDFLDSSGRLLVHGMHPVLDASAKGQFEVPKDFKHDLIYVKAYTRWMLNFDSSFHYNKKIGILQPVENYRPRPEPKPEIQFFAEGGNFVEGLNNRLAFKANYNSGKPAQVKGYIINKKNEKVVDFNSLHDGMGTFSILPEPGEIYKAKWKDEQGNDYTTNLPKISSGGIAMRVGITPKGRTFTLEGSPGGPPNLKKLFVVATMHRHLVYMANVNLAASPVTTGIIPTEDLPTGIMQVTLFDSNWLAIAERITFVNNDEYHFEPEVGFAALETRKRGKNMLVISLPTDVEANFSVSVTDAGIGTDSSNNIFSGLLLNGDIKGYVHDPTYYFRNNSDTLQQQLDLVMLTNGWRKIKWEDVVHGKMPVITYQNDTSYLSVQGKVYGLTASQLSQGAMLLFIIDDAKKGQRETQQAFIDNKGNFSNPDIILMDTVRVYYQLAGGVNVAASEVSFETGWVPSPNNYSVYNGFFENPFSDSALENRNRWFANEQLRLQKLREGTTLSEVVVKSKVKTEIEKLDERYTSALFSRGDAVQFDVLNDPAGKSSLNILTYLQGKVAGLMISQTGGTGNKPSVTWRGGVPEIYVNESQSQIETLSSISLSNIAYIKVFRPPFTGSFGGGSGAIAIYTKTGADITVPQNKGLPSKLIIGYTPDKEFYSPNYQTFDSRNQEEDVRSTLYWNPMIVTSRENHVIRIPFFNNDITDSFRIIVEGVTTEGKLTHIEKVIE